MASSRTLHKAVVVFPAIAMVVSLGCVSASQADSRDTSVARKTTTTVKRSKGPASTLPPKGAPASAALSVLATIRQERERPQGYRRELFRHWTDEDSDSCNTREEVLIAESTSPAQVDAFGCKVIEGDWFSPYDGVMHTDPSDLDIDHVVALKEAWDSGAWRWNAQQRRQFANDMSDPRALIAVTAGVNRSKGDRDPSNWLPPRSEYLCTYIADWVAVKARWRLSMDSSEWGRVRNILTNNCVNVAIAPWGSTPSAGGGSPDGTVTPPVSAAPSNSAPVDTSGKNSGGVLSVTPGSWCAPEGANGIGAKNGKPYVCSKTRVTGEPYTDGRARWRPVS